jgi:hypothetical protein
LNELFLVDGVSCDDEVKRWSQVAFCFCFFACEVPLRRKLGPVERRGLDRASISGEGVLVGRDVRLEEMGRREVGCEDVVA